MGGSQRLVSANFAAMVSMTALSGSIALAQIGEIPGVSVPPAGPSTPAAPEAVAPTQRDPITAPPPGVRVIPLPSSPSRSDSNVSQTAPPPPNRSAAPPATTENPAVPPSPPSEPESSRAAGSNAPARRVEEIPDPFADRAGRRRGRMEFEERRAERFRLRDWRRAIGPFAIAQLCDPDLWQFVEIYFKAAEQAVRPTEAQRSNFDALRRSTARAQAEVLATCGADINMTAAGRLAAVETRLVSVLQAVRTVRPALDAFYQSLSEEQRARFDALVSQAGRRGRQQRGWR